MFSRNMYPWMSAKWKELMVDQPAREALRAEDKRHIQHVKLHPLQDVDSGIIIEYDERIEPKRRDFPVGDSRRW